MTTVNVQSPTGDLARSVELPDEIFDVQVNVPLLHQVVVAQLAAARQGTADTKTRGEVRGGGRKPYRQKGTGRARQGSTRAPQFAGGGVVHGPTPRNYSQRTPKKMKAAALRSALSDRARGGRVHVVAGLVDGDVPSTKSAAVALAKIVTSRHVLLVADREDVTTWKSLRNVPSVHVIAPDQLNTYDVLVSDDVVFTEGALATFLSGGKSGIGEAVSALAQEPADRPAPTKKTPAAKSAPADAAKKTAAKKATPAKKTEEPAVSENSANSGSAPATAATDAGETKPAGEGVSDQEMASEVAAQTSPDLKAEEAFEKAAEKDTDAPAEQALADETPALADESGPEGDK
jgi:large subunit ribosomal protein L4